MNLEIKGLQDAIDILIQKKNVFYKIVASTESEKEKFSIAYQIGGIDSEIDEYRKKIGDIEQTESLNQDFRPSKNQLALENYTNLAEKDMSLDEKMAVYAHQQKVLESFWQIDAELAQHYPEILFNRLYADKPLSKKELADISHVIKDKHTNWQRKIMVVGSLTVSLLRKFDAQRLDLLIDFVNNGEHQVWQRAYTGLVLSLEIHQIQPSGLKRKFPKLLDKIAFLQNNEKTQKAYTFLSQIMLKKSYRLELDSNEYTAQVNKILQTSTLSDSEKSDFLEIIECFTSYFVEDNKIMLAKVIGSTLGSITFFNKNQTHHWFMGFNVENELIRDTMFKSKKHIEENFLHFLADYSLSNIFSNSLMFSLIEVSQFELNLLNKFMQDSIKHIKIVEEDRNIFLPLHSFLTDLYIYEQFYPKNQEMQIVSENTNLFESSFNNFFLKENHVINLKVNYYLNLISTCDNLNQKMEYCKQAIEIKKDNHILWTILGGLYYTQKNYLEAISCLKKAILIEKNNHLALLLLGNSYTCLEQYSKAMRCYNKSISTNPNFSEAYKGRAELKHLLGRSEERDLDFKKAYELNPYDPELIYFRTQEYNQIPQTGEEHLIQVINSFNTIETLEKEELIPFVESLLVKLEKAISLLNNPSQILQSRLLKIIVYALMENKADIIKELKIVIENAPHKNVIKQSIKIHLQDIEWLWQDKDFLALVGE